MEKTTGKVVNSKKRISIGSRLLLTPEFGVIVPIVILCVITSIVKPNFLTWKYISSILTGSIFIGAAALGEAFVIMNGEIDISVGMSGCFGGIMYGVAATEWGWPLIPCIILLLVTAGIVGVINGFLVCKLGMSSWITTLATQFIFQGLAVTVSDGMPMSVGHLNITSFVVAKPLGLSNLFFIFIALLIVLDLVVRKTPFGYKLRAVGGNREAAELAGINVVRIKWLSFIIAGLLAGVGGLFDVMQNTSASSFFGTGREFRAITCCAIGGISMTGGKGSILGVGLGVLLFHTLWYCLRILDVDTNLQLVLIGAILVAAVIMDVERKKYEARKMV